MTTVELSIGLSTVGLSTVVIDNSRGYKRQAVRATTDRQHGLQQTGSTVYKRQAAWSATDREYCLQQQTGSMVYNIR